MFPSNTSRHVPGQALPKDIVAVCFCLATRMHTDQTACSGQHVHPWCSNMHEDSTVVRRTFAEANNYRADCLPLEHQCSCMHTTDAGTYHEDMKVVRRTLAKANAYRADCLPLPHHFT